GREEQTVHDVVRRAQEAGYAAARKDASAESVDAAARRVIDEAGFGAFFIHRTGHGIGLDGHEHPYLVRGNHERLEPGMAFSTGPRARPPSSSRSRLTRSSARWPVPSANAFERGLSPAIELVSHLRLGGGERDRTRVLVGADRAPSGPAGDPPRRRRRNPLL